MKFPKTIYVRIDDSDLLSNATVAEAIDGDGPTRVGIYQLTETLTAEKTVITSPAKKTRRA